MTQQNMQVRLSRPLCNPSIIPTDIDVSKASLLGNLFGTFGENLGETEVLSQEYPKIESAAMLSAALPSCHAPGASSSNQSFGQIKVPIPTQLGNLSATKALLLSTL